MRAENYRTICQFCHTNCGIIVRRASSGIDSVKGDPEHPMNSGRSCSKVAAIPELVNSKDRSSRKTKGQTIRTEFHWDTHNTGGKKLFSELQDLTWTHAGPIRNACSLEKGLQWNPTMKKRTEELVSKEKSILLNELKGSLMVSEAILRASLEIKEGREAFYRNDFSSKNDANWLKNIFLKLDSERNHFIASHHPTNGQH